MADTQDEIRERSVALAIKVGKTGGKLTADLLKWALRQYLKQRGDPNVHHGRQTVKQLVRQNAGVQSIEITEKNIQSFERVARKYGVDFALKKDRAAGRYLVFFKARDADALHAAFAEYANKTVHHKKRGKASIREKLTHLKEAAKEQTQEKLHQKGGLER